MSLTPVCSGEVDAVLQLQPAVTLTLAVQPLVTQDVLLLVATPVPLSVLLLATTHVLLHLPLLVQVQHVHLHVLQLVQHQLLLLAVLQLQKLAVHLFPSAASHVVNDVF